LLCRLLLRLTLLLLLLLLAPDSTIGYLLATWCTCIVVITI
jgi:hypothetical protein